jgi:hypothetical protein
MRLSDTIQKIAQGQLYSESALKQCLEYKVLSENEKKAVLDRLQGHNDSNISMRLQDAAIKTKLHNKSGSLTYYGFACGYVESKVSLKTEDYLHLEKDCLFHVKGYKGNERIWQSFDSLTAARKFFRSVRIR